MVLEFWGERCAWCVANNAPVHRKMQQIISNSPAGILDWQVCRWPIMIHIPWPLTLTFQIVDSDLLADVGAGPIQSISFDHGSDQPS
jgi:hypothetical protein